jgi:hypothetical protein
MNPRLIRKHASLVLKIASLFLCAAVFAWGLQYKLSLYNSSSHPNPTSVAKLIQAERSNREVAVLHLRNLNRIPFSLEKFIPAFGPSVLSRRNMPIAKSVLPAIGFVPSVLFFRPPPRANS